MNFIDRYVKWMKSRCPDFGEVKFAIDCSNGMASLLVRKIFPNAHVINDKLDGNFSAHSPNPLDPNSRLAISSFVKCNNLDCGLIFDGDADRVMFVDENARFIQPDYLIPIIAAALGEKGKVIHDIRTSRSSIEALREMNCEPVMVPVGHAFAKPILREVGAFCGGELAGHYYFRDFHGCDSGILAAMLVLGEIAKAKARGISFSKMMDPIMSKYANSEEVNFRVTDKDKAIERVLEVAQTFGEIIGRSDIDGTRLEFKNGWFNVRKSNTEPYLRLIVECCEKRTLDMWYDKLSRAIHAG